MATHTPSLSAQVIGGEAEGGLVVAEVRESLTPLDNLLIALAAWTPLDAVFLAALGTVPLMPVP